MSHIPVDYVLDKLDQKVYVGDIIFYAIVDSRDPILRRARILEILPSDGRSYVANRMKIQPLREDDEDGNALRVVTIDAGDRPKSHRRFVRI